MRAAESPKPAADLPATCYLFAYFYHDREGEGFRLAWSADGHKFEMLRDGQSWLKPTAGENKLMRDPHLYRGPDGIFHLVWTTGWTGKTIGYASSPDLVTWSEQKTLPVMAYEPEAQNCWAPELVWDPASGITSSTGPRPSSGATPRQRCPTVAQSATTASTRRRRRTLSLSPPTKLLYDAGYNVIDANLMAAEDGTTDWLMFVKDETLAPVTQKNIRLVRGRTPEGPWDPVSPPLTGSAYWAEGPTAIKVGREYRVYFDKHMLNAIGLVRSRDLKTWEDVSDQVNFPKDARHGCIIAVPRAVVERLLKVGPVSDRPESATTP